MNITWIGSPNFDKNRKPITKIVCHWFGDASTKEPVISSVNSHFQKPGGTSAHYAIEGDTIYQYVKEEDVAYHAGIYTVNQESIGIEHSGGPNRQVSDKTYENSARLIARICKQYGIPFDRSRIIKHSEVPRATACPGTLDIDRLINLAKSFAQEPVQPPVLSDPKLKFDFKGLQHDSTTEKYEILEMSVVGSKLVAKDARIKQLEERVRELENQPPPTPSPIFTQPIAIKFFEIAKEFEK